MNRQEARRLLFETFSPEVVEQLIEALTTNELRSYQAMETALQALAGQILSLRTELLVMKAAMVQGEE